MIMCFTLFALCEAIGPIGIGIFDRDRHENRDVFLHFPCAFRIVSCHTGYRPVTVDQSAQEKKAEAAKRL